MRAQLVSGVLQILMVLRAQGAQNHEMYLSPPWHPPGPIPDHNQCQSSWVIIGHDGAIRSEKLTVHKGQPGPFAQFDTV